MIQLISEDIRIKMIQETDVQITWSYDTLELWRKAQPNDNDVSILKRLLVNRLAGKLRNWHDTTNK